MTFILLGGEEGFIFLAEDLMYRPVFLLAFG